MDKQNAVSRIRLRLWVGGLTGGGNVAGVVKVR